MGLMRKVKKLKRDLEGEGTQAPSLAQSNILVRGLYHLYKFAHITVREIFQDQLPLKSMALTFATLLTIVPLLVISFSIFNLFGGGDWFVETLRPILMENLAPGTGPRVVDKIQEMVEGTGLSTLSGLGVLILLLAVYSIFTGIETTINSIWGTRSRAGTLQRLPLYWGLVTIVPLLVLGSVALTTYLQAVPIISEAVQRVNFGSALANRVTTVFMVTVAFFLLYRFVPATTVRNRSALLGALVAGILHELVKGLFILYTTDLVQVDAFYGSLAAVPLLLIWVNLSWVVVLGGVEISFVTQHYKTLLYKPKHVRLARSQETAIAYLLLREATRTFYSMRGNVVLEDWAEEWNVPPNAAERIADLLQRGGFIERAGKNYTQIILARSPKKIYIREVDDLLADETFSEWKWPRSKSWHWLREWQRKRTEASLEAANAETLRELVEWMNTEISGGKAQALADSDKDSKKTDEGNGRSTPGSRRRRGAKT